MPRGGKKKTQTAPEAAAAPEAAPAPAEQEPVVEPVPVPQADASSPAEASAEPVPVPQAEASAEAAAAAAPAKGKRGQRKRKAESESAEEPKPKRARPTRGKKTAEDKKEEKADEKEEESEDKPKKEKKAKKAPAATAEKKKVAEKKKEKKEPAAKKQKKAAAEAEEQEEAAAPLLTAPDFEDAVVLTVGSGDMAQLGLGEEEREKKGLTLVPALEGKQVVRISCGSLHNAVVTKKGEVYTWGAHDDKALGRDGDIFTPGHVTQLDHRKIVAVSCGGSHTIALSDDGKVYCCGLFRDANGVMGFGSNEEVSDRVVLMHAIPEPCVAIASGDNHALALTVSGRVYTWGDVGLGKRSSARTMKKTKLQPSLVPFKTGTKKIVAIYAGGSTSFAVAEDKKVYVWGPNNYGQGGLQRKNDQDVFITVPTEVPTLSAVDTVKIAADIHHSMALTREGKVYTFGRGHYGRLGHGDEVTREVPTLLDFKFESPEDKIVDVACGEGHCWAVTDKGVAYSWGSGDLRQLAQREGDYHVPTKVVNKALAGRVVIAVSAGSQHTMALARPTTATAAAPATATAPAAAAATAPAPAPAAAE